MDPGGPSEKQNYFFRRFNFSVMSRCFRERFNETSHTPESIQRILRFNFRMCESSHIHKVQACPNLFESVPRHDSSHPLPPILWVFAPEGPYFWLSYQSHEEYYRNEFIENVHSDVLPKRLIFPPEFVRAGDKVVHNF